MGYVDREKTIVCDLDGVLTDGKQYITSDGSKMFKAFHSRDIAAIRELIFNGWRFVIVTADDDESGKHFADKVGAEFLVLRDKSQIPFLYQVAIGDSAWDIPMLEKAKFAFYPADGDYLVMPDNAKDLGRKGGEGVMSSVVWKMKELEVL